ncbi:MAG: sigma-70 family RNA polymerase sigma factor [Clostridia bacterium]
MSTDFSKLSEYELCKNIDNPFAFSELEYRYLWLIRISAREFLKSNHFDFEDFIQEGLLGLYYCAKSFDQNKNASFKTYASTCIKNRMLNELKKNIKLNSGNSVPLDEIQFSVPSPEEDFELREDFKAVLNQIHVSLSDFEKKVLSIYLSGYKRSEIPEKFGFSLKAYDNALARCRNKLKKHKRI